jgi:hypothetical protein
MAFAETLRKQSEFAQAAFLLLDICRVEPDYSRHRWALYDCLGHLGWTDVARWAAEAIGGRDDSPFACLVRAEMRQAMGLDDEVLADHRSFQGDDHLSAAGRLIWAEAKMRRDGLAVGVEDYRRAWVGPEALQALYGGLPEFDLDRYWHGQRPLPKRLNYGMRGGVGDSLQWMRYLPFLTALGVEIAEVVGPAQALRLKPIESPEDMDRAWAAFGDWGVSSDDGVMWTEPFAAFTSLFPVLGFAAPRGGYLEAPVDDLAGEILAWIRRQAGERPAVAITWSANESAIFAKRSLTLEQVRPLLAMPDIFWVVAQRGHQRDAWSALPDAEASAVLPTSLDFGQTGAIITGLDAVVTIDCSIAHLAGGLACKTFMLAGRVADWRWGPAPSTDAPYRSDWYHNMEIIRQPTFGDWPGAVSQLQRSLRAYFGL